MPRPGPRPYECVRRAWHSDRHQPMRGSLIQEIFRIANEVHSTVTKKNKEWQEKLPVVVLKAEEIMYSKANSEAEYMDLKTLQDRTNDAVNTIIRLDESTETGNLLQPCIEAALNLGCTPRRASRSQSNSAASYYLNPVNPRPDHLFADAMQGAVKRSSNLHCAPVYSNFGATTEGNLASTGSKLEEYVTRANNCQNGEVVRSKLRCSEDNKSAMMASYPCSGLWSVFPLFHGDSVELKSALGVQSPLEPLKSLEPVTVGVARNLFGVESTPVKISKLGRGGGIASPREFECDLSLRLGSPSSFSSAVDMKNKLNDREPFRDILVSPWVIEDGLSGSHSSKSCECANINFTSKKRKVALSHNSNDHALSWDPKLPCNQSISGTKAQVYRSREADFRP